MDNVITLAPVQLYTEYYTRIHIASKEERSRKKSRAYCVFVLSLEPIKPNSNVTLELLNIYVTRFR